MIGAVSQTALAVGAPLGVRPLHDFRPRPMVVHRPDCSFPSSGVITGSEFSAVVPADLARIYQFNPLFAAGITGQGQDAGREANIIVDAATTTSVAAWAYSHGAALGVSTWVSGEILEPLSGRWRTLRAIRAPTLPRALEITEAWRAIPRPSSVTYSLALQSYKPNWMHPSAVGPRIDSTAPDDPDLIRPVQGEPASATGISQ